MKLSLKLNLNYLSLKYSLEAIKFFYNKNNFCLELIDLLFV